MLESYYTVETRASAVLTEKRSKFIATVLPIQSGEEAVECIEALRSQYWDARHNVYAYTLLDGQIKRYSDDGEPSGTAGVPVLNVLEKLQLKNTLVVVTRYFGGILLGTGGLMRAYSGAAKCGIEQAGVVLRCLCDVVKITCDYTLFGKIQKFTENQHIIVKDVEYADTVSIYVYQKQSETNRFMRQITELTDAKAVLKTVGQAYVNFGEEK